MPIHSRYEKFLFSEGKIATLKSWQWSGETVINPLLWFTRNSRLGWKTSSSWKNCIWLGNQPKNFWKYVVGQTSSSLESTHMPMNQISLPENVLHFFLKRTSGDSVLEQLFKGGWFSFGVKKWKTEMCFLHKL